MKSVLLALSAAGSVAAQLDFPHQADIVAALNPDDPQYTACSFAEELVDYCVTSVGGTAALETADPTQFLDCACCFEGTAVSPYFSICSTYIMDEARQYSTEASAFGTFYSLCALDVDCDNLGGFTTPAFSTSEAPFPTSTGFAITETSDFFSESSATITSASAVQTYAEACSEMISIFESCTNKISDFTDLPYGEQASCYCCQGTVWNDDLDKFATTCANWAITGDPSTAYPVAKTFASLCEKFTDVCSATATGTEATATGGSDGSSGGSSGGSSKNGQVTVTVTPTASATGNAATAPRVDFGVGAVAAVLAALPFAL